MTAPFAAAILTNDPLLTTSQASTGITDDLQFAELIRLCAERTEKVGSFLLPKNLRHVRGRRIASIMDKIRNLNSLSPKELNPLFEEAVILYFNIVGHNWTMCSGDETKAIQKYDIHTLNSLFDQFQTNIEVEDSENPSVRLLSIFRQIIKMPGIMVRFARNENPTLHETLSFVNSKQTNHVYTNKECATVLAALANN